MHDHQHCERCGCSVDQHQASTCAACENLLRLCHSIAESDRRTIAWSWVVVVASVALAIAVAWGQQ